MWFGCAICLFFFFQAEDGIRDLTVTGVQTCALPISQFFVEMFVAAIDVIDAAHFGNSVRLQSGKNQRGRRAQVARHHWSAKEMIDALDDRSRTFKIDMCAHTL